MGGNPPNNIETVSRVIHELTDPISIASMVIGGAAFQSARLGIRTWFMARGLTAEALAFTAGVAVETPAIVLSSRTFLKAFKSEFVPQTTVGQDLAAMALAMGPLRVLGTGGALLARHWGHPTGALHHVFTQAGLFTGILLGQWGERRWLHSSSVDSLTALTDGLKTFGHFHLGGLFLPHPFAKFFRNWEQRLILREQSSANAITRVWNHPGWEQGAPAVAAAALGWRSLPVGEMRHVFTVGLEKGETAPAPRLKGANIKTTLEDRLRKGLVVPPSELGPAIQQLIDEIPPGPHLLNPDHGESIGFFLLKGQFRHRRLEALHRLLLGGKDPKKLRAIDNGPGLVPDTALTLARLGSSVTVKEPMEEELSLLQNIFEDAAPQKLRRRIRCIPPQEIDLPTPADVVYWTNIAIHNLQYPEKVRLEHYLGRDVKPGGYIVLQTDHALGFQQEFLNLRFDPNQWERIFYARLPNLFGGSNYILPTAQNNNLQFQIYRRKPS